MNKLSCVAILFAFSSVLCADNSLAANDYPTEARADYVFGCMAVNGQTREALRKCSCAIDHIANILPYDTYVEAETVLSLSRVSGERMSIFKTAAMPQAIVKELRSAQAEAEIVCFSTF